MKEGAQMGKNYVHSEKWYTASMYTSRTSSSGLCETWNNECSSFWFNKLVSQIQSM